MDNLFDSVNLIYVKRNYSSACETLGRMNELELAQGLIQERISQIKFKHMFSWIFTSWVENAFKSFQIAGHFYLFFAVFILTKQF